LSQKRKLKKNETLEKLQGKGGKSKAAKYRRDKEIRTVRNLMMSKELLTKEVKL
jgi:hypothetical protein